jgi:UPF0042 nucleotide-binding protein
VLDLIDLVIPAHVAEGRAHLAIGFGCTGGKHRSVTMVEMLQKELQLRGWHVSIRHRELLEQAAPSDTSDSKVLSS